MTQLRTRFPELQEGVPLAPLTTMKIGGDARYFLTVTKREDLVDALRIAREEQIPVFFLGGGSNVLISSQGFAGLVIKNEMRAMRVEGNRIIAESGVILASVIKAAKDNGLVGLAPLHGVPGTFGAAVRGNCGVPQCETGDFVVSAVLLDKNLAYKTVDREYFGYSYRHSHLKESGEIVVEATIELLPGGDPKQIQEEMMIMLKSRKAKQPWGKSGGSFFKNPTREYSAGFLVDQVGGKGMRVGDALVSEMHANFFQNAGHATSEEMQSLASLIKQRVKEQFNIALEEEVEFIEARPSAK